MSTEVNIHLYGSLPFLVGRKQNQPINISLDGPVPISDVLSDHQIPTEEIQLIMRNHRPVHPDDTIRPGDRLALFPKEYPFFVDWYDYRATSKANDRRDDNLDS
ncbi:MAG: hypothetical protein DSY90_15320 [Deltaproteobacteria bacterium]|nr:MAG: hypothetical protein DSY90_15320 [Deltaproteobacteria bacterium]